MDRQQMALLVAGAALVLVVLVTAAWVTRARRLARELAGARADVAALREQVDELRHRLEAAAPRGAGAPEEAREFVITTMPDGSAPDHRPATSDAPGGPALSAGALASVAVGESVVRLLSLGYGVRRALSAENRNRIRFEVRREVKRARRRRRRDLREAKRQLRTERPGGEPADLRSDAA